MTRSKVVLLVAAVLGVLGIGYVILGSHVEATREFNCGVKAYEDKKFDTAVKCFRRSAELSPKPRTVYNLALASWESAKDARKRRKNGDGREEISQEEFEEKTQTAHEAIGEALTTEGLDDKQIVNLTYIEGRLLAVEGKIEEAKSRLRKALVLQEGFKPALRELVRLGTTDEQDFMRELLVTLAEDEEPEILTEYR